MQPDGINLLRIDEQFVDAADLVTNLASTFADHGRRVVRHGGRWHGTSTGMSVVGIGSNSVSQQPAEISFDSLIGARADYAAALRDIESAVWAQTSYPRRSWSFAGCGWPKSWMRNGIRTPHPSSGGRWVRRIPCRLVGAVADGPRFRQPHSRLPRLREQILIDAQEVSDEHARAVIAEIGEGGFLVLTYACGLFETTQRARLIMGATRW